jgi:hypothetical protein
MLMKVRTTLWMLLVCSFAVAVYAADNPNMGTWKLNEAKSKIPAGAPKTSTVVYAAQGDDVKVTTDGVDGKGSATHSEWVGKFDGKDYPVTGDPNNDTRAYKQDNERKLSLTLKKAGKVTGTGTIEVSHDGKFRTVELETIAPDGKKIKSKGAYDKQ